MSRARWARGIRDPDRAATAWTATVVGAAVLAVLGPALVGARTLISVNALTNYFPWRVNGTDTAGHQLCTGDTIDTVMPSIAFARGQWFDGHLGAWQGYVGGGSPVGALPSHGLLDPLSLPYFVLPLWLAPAFVKLLELLVAGGGTYLFVRRLGVSRSGGLLAGAAFATSGFMVMWTNWPQTRVAALIPALFWAAERLLQQRRPRDAALLAVVVTSILLGGFPAVTAWALELAGLYFVVRLAVAFREDLRAAGRAVLLAVSGLATGGLLAMVQLYPFAKAYAETDAGARRSYGLTPLATTRLVTLIDPGAYGLCRGGGAGATSVENVAFIGAAALVLAVAGAALGWRLVARLGGTGSNGVARRLASGYGASMFFAVAAVVIAIIGWSSRDVLAHLQSIPPFSKNPVGRIRSVLGFALAVLVGIGYDAVLRRRAVDATSSRWSWPQRIRVAAVVVGLAVAGIVLLFKVRAAGLSQHLWPDVKPTLYVPLLLVVATVVVLVLALTQRSWARVIAIVVLPVLVASQGAWFFHQVLPGDDPDNFYPRTAVHQFLADHVASERYDATGMVSYPSTALYYSLRTATGHVDASPEWVDLLRAVDAKVSLTPTFTAFSGAMTPARVADAPILDRMGVRYWVFGPGVVAGSPVPDTSSPGAGSPGGYVVSGTAATSCTVNGPMRGFTVTAAAPIHLATPTKPAVLSVTATNHDRSVHSAVAVPADVRAGQSITVGVLGETFAGATTLRLSMTGTDGPVELAGSGGVATCTAIAPANDGLRLVMADAGATVYQRLTALPRVRWAGRAEVVSNEGQQLATLAKGLASDTVLLPSAAGSGSGQNASVDVRSDEPGAVRVHVNAAGAGYLTVADAMTQSGWTVSVDGKRAPLLRGDYAMGTVAVPRGSHEVEFRYRAPGFSTGILLSGIGALALVMLVFGETFLGRARRRSAGQTEVVAQNVET